MMLRGVVEQVSPRLLVRIKRVRYEAQTVVESLSVGDRVVCGNVGKDASPDWVVIGRFSTAAPPAPTALYPSLTLFPSTTKVPKG